MTRNLLCLFLALICLFSLSLTGCGKADTSADKEAYTSDGLHFNDAGHHKIAACLQAFLEEL